MQEWDRDLDWREFHLPTVLWFPLRAPQTNPAPAQVRGVDYSGPSCCLSTLLFRG